MFIDGIRSLLSSIAHYSIVGEAHNGQEALEKIKNLKPDLVLLDMNMPIMDGLQTLKIIKEKHQSVKVIMLTMFDTREYIQKLLKNGANGYILKNTGKEELSQGIETVMSGQAFYSKQVMERIMEGLQGIKEDKSSYGVIEITEREKDVLKLLVKEFTTQEIADKLFISVNTVETHRKNLISKLGVRNLAGLVKYAMQNGLAED
jgi:DNA-binding NarL/FixJ family response regulator